MADFLNLLQRKHLVWRGRGHRHAMETISTGFKELDTALYGGWPRHGMILVESLFGSGELRLLLPHLGQDERIKVLIQPPSCIYAEALAYQGVRADELMLLECDSHKDALWSAEQCLKSGACGTVMLWHEQFEVAVVKRLQLAAEQGDCRLFALHNNAFMGSLPIALSLSVKAQESGIQIEIKKHRGNFSHATVKLENRFYWPELQAHQPFGTANNIVMLTHAQQRLSS
ncbi:translesion DNA synthesis-associated protein ImuA [Pseudoalteromonas sp. T1lg65]|uniref:translesion DNA synthesis-associated protein ImuA n=1 Tax=Pseudoalteromonas sp. T1lg65 TaxID=2077101 RepID=UPI003F7B1698